MPRYDYHCAANGKTVEVVHGMREKAETWGRLCELLGIEAGETPRDAPVERLLNREVAIRGSARTRGMAGPAGSCCRGGACGCR
jgi:hypothetical protein